MASQAHHYYQNNNPPTKTAIHAPSHGTMNAAQRDNALSLRRFDLEQPADLSDEMNFEYDADGYMNLRQLDLQNENETINYETLPSLSRANDRMIPRSMCEGRQVRNARLTARSHSPLNRGGASSRVTKPAKTKRPVKNSTKTPHLEKPLSELTKDMNIPIRDMEAWVNRPLEVRLNEVEKRNGYVTRPMNSFMLYRSAYAERTKQFCIQNNHQVVSAVSGQSWPKEPPEIRDFYNRLAHIERDNHTRAHPNYKFSPSKGANTAYSRKNKDESSEEESNDGDTDNGADPDRDWLPRGSQRRPRREKRDSNRHGMQNLTVAFPSKPDRSRELSGSHDSSAFQPSQWNYAQPMPNIMSEEQMHWQNAQQIRSGQMIPHDQQLQQYWKSFVPVSQYLHHPSLQYSFQQTSPLIGLPSADFYESLTQNLAESSSDNSFQIDPSLLQFEHQQTPPFEEPPTPKYEMDDLSPLAGVEVLQSTDTSNFPKQAKMAYHVEPRSIFDAQQHDNTSQSPSGRLSDFDNWMELAPPSSALSP